jgi:hypothetical protein
MEQPDRQPLLEAALDLRYLLGRGYPRELGLKLTGDRWALDAAGRQILRRGIFAPDEANRRRERLLPLSRASERKVAIDGHNVIITLEVAMNGGRLVLADDGLVRDIAQLGRNHQPDAKTLAAARLMVGSLAHAGAASALILLDAPLPRSGQLAARLRELLIEAGLKGEARALAVPEKELAGFAGLVASSDRVVIDQAAEPLDLAGEIIALMDPSPSLESLQP